MNSLRNLVILLAILSLPFLFRDGQKKSDPEAPVRDRLKQDSHNIPDVSPVPGKQVTKTPTERRFSKPEPQSATPDYLKGQPAEQSARDDFYQKADLLPAIDEEVEMSSGGRSIHRRMLRFPGESEQIIITEHHKNGKELLHRRAYVGEHLVVRFEHAPPGGEGDKIAGSDAFTISKNLGSPGLYTVSFQEKTLAAFRQLKQSLLQIPGVLSVGEDFLIFAALAPSDPDFGKLWGHTQESDIDVDAPEAWNYNYDCRAVQVAVLDTGADRDHPDLVENLVLDKAAYYPGAGSSPEDGHSHGTHVAGTLGAVGNNGVGINGVCWKASIIPVKVLNDSGVGTNAGLISGINYVAANTDARIINASLASEGDTPEVKTAIENFVKGEKIFVAAAGNAEADKHPTGVNLDLYPRYPASYSISRMITVGALNAQNAVAGFSNYGKAVKISAPGDGIYSTMPGGGFGYKNGTSMAAPLVAGAVALVWSLDTSLGADWLISSLYEAADTHEKNKTTEAARSLNLDRFMQKAIDFSTLLKNDYQNIFSKEIAAGDLETWRKEISSGNFQFKDSRLDYLYEKQEFSDLAEARCRRILNQVSADVISEWKKSLYEKGAGWASLEKGLTESSRFTEAARKVYQNAMGVDHPDLESWRNQVKDGGSLPELLSGVLNSEPFLTRLSGIWKNVMGSDIHPDVASWSDRVRGGDSVDLLRTELIASESFSEVASGSHLRIMGENISDQILAEWRAGLNAEGSFQSLEQALINSEKTTENIREIFLNFLEVEATSKNLATVRDFLSSGGSVLDFSEQVLNSLKVKIELNKIFSENNFRDMQESDLLSMKERLKEAGSLAGLRSQSR